MILKASRHVKIVVGLRVNLSLTNSKCKLSRFLRMHTFLKYHIKNFETTANLGKSTEITHFHGQNLCFFETEVWREFQTCNFLCRMKIDEWHAIWNGGQELRLKYAWTSDTYPGKPGSWHEKADHWIAVFLQCKLSSIERSEHQIPCLKIQALFVKKTDQKEPHFTFKIMLTLARLKIYKPASVCKVTYPLMFQR